VSKCLVLYVSEDGRCAIGHHGIELKDPEKYARRLNDNGHRAQVVNLDTGEIFGVEALCPHCDSAHDLPYDGGCLL